VVRREYDARAATVPRSRPYAYDQRLQAKFIPAVAYPLSDHDAIRMMMFEFGLGMDCAGYVQQALLVVTGASRTDLGLMGGREVRAVVALPRRAARVVREPRGGMVRREALGGQTTPTPYDRTVNGVYRRK
jgi:hypothetical protein